MRGIKRRLLIMAGIFMLVITAGCTSGAKSENEIIDDLINDLNNFSVRDYYNDAVIRPANEPEVVQSYSDLFEITNFNIDKRQTDKENKTDVVWASLEAELNDGSGTGSASCVVTYNLYNEGWMLEDLIWEQPLTFKPKELPNLSDEEIFEAAKQFLDDPLLENMEIYERPETADNYISYKLTATASHKYVDESYDINCGYSFDVYGLFGWQMDTCYEEVTKQDWSQLIGVSYKDEDGYEILITDVDYENASTLKTIYFNRIRETDHGTFYASEYKRDLIDASDMTIEEFVRRKTSGNELINYTHYILNKEGYELVLEPEGLSYIFDNDIAYLMGYEAIGRDAIYYLDLNTSSLNKNTKGERIVKLTCYNLPPIS